MKKTTLKMLGAASLALTALTATAQDTTKMTQKASYIAMTAAKHQTEDFAQFLTGAAELVRETEPGTKLWFALQAPGEQLSIFDIFVDERAREAHFSGVVAGALKDNAERLVGGGWDKGVVANIENSSVLSAKAPVDVHTATTATYIKLKSAPGQGDALAELLTAAGAIVAGTEPKTLYWLSLRIDANTFAIFDVFADDSGRQSHFAGQVASLLKEQSSVLVDGGWEQGVVANVKNYEILAIK